MDHNISFGYAQGSACCIIMYNGFEFVGEAQCHPDDMDMESERTGLCIAEARAMIKVMRFKRDHEIAPQLKILNHLYSNMGTSKYFNPKSYEAKMLRSQIKDVKNQLATVSNEIADEQKYLKEYIQKKDNLYRKLRARNQQS